VDGKTSTYNENVNAFIFPYKIENGNLGSVSLLPDRLKVDEFDVQSGCPSLPKIVSCNLKNGFN
jgi:hypothetical protein